MPKLNLTAEVEALVIPRDIRDLSDHELMARLSLTRPATALLDEQERRDMIRYRTNGPGWQEHLAAIPQEVLCRLAYRSERHFYYREIERRNGVEAGAAEARAQPARPAEEQAVEAGARPSSPKAKSFEELARLWEQLLDAEWQALLTKQGTSRKYVDAARARRSIESNIRPALEAGPILVGEAMYSLNEATGEIEKAHVRLGGVVPCPPPDDSQKA